MNKTVYTQLSGRDRTLLRLILTLKPDVAAVKVSLTGSPGEITKELERILRGIEKERSKGVVLDKDDVDNPLLAAQWVLGIQS